MKNLPEETRQIRSYLPNDLELNNWEQIKSFFDELLNRHLHSVYDLKKWLQDKSELEAALSEEMGWRYIKTSCDTNNESLAKAYQYYVENILPHVSKLSNQLDKTLINCQYVHELKEEPYQVMLRTVKKQIELFREENIPIFTELQTTEQEYGKISGAMTIKHDDKELTLQQANNYLKDTNRNVREEVFNKIYERRIQDKDALNELLSRLLDKRHTAAQNAGFDNYRDYKYQELGRFDYTVKDCHSFHHSIASQVCPIVDRITQKRKEKLGYSTLRPWDMDVDPDLKPPLKPFSDIDELVNKAVKVFSNIRPKYGDFIMKMDRYGYLDLDSRKGKAPGGFNYPLYESNIPFIFMNATHNLRDLETLMHEGGHAIHSFLSKDLELVSFKDIPSEAAELASMSMELISMDQWHLFFDDEESLKRAQRTQLEGVLSVLPWVAIIDSFQDWFYTHPGHSEKERMQEWVKIYQKFSSDHINWDGMEHYRRVMWQKQLHIYEVPLYYIEYAIAQLGAIAVWRNYKSNPQNALNSFEAALSMGYTAPLPKIYQTAGIEFNFSDEYVKELMQFVDKELERLY
jgi:oligoendopeptidase F